MLLTDFEEINRLFGVNVVKKGGDIINEKKLENIHIVLPEGLSGSARCKGRN